MSKYKEAGEIIEEEMEGVWGEVYLPMANIFLTFGQRDNRRNRSLRNALGKEIEDVERYERFLKLREAVAGVEYEMQGRTYRRELFVSHPEGAAVCWLEVCGGRMDFAISVDSDLKHIQYVQCDEGGKVRASPRKGAWHWSGKGGGEPGSGWRSERWRQARAGPASDR